MEKIKIYVTERIANILEKDAEGFEFFKKDGITVNKNALLTNLIINYRTSFAEQQSALLNFLKNKISPSVTASENSLNGLCFELCEKINERSAAPNGEKFDKLISLKPTTQSQPVIDYIEQYCLTGRSLSEYFRSMLASYAALPQDKRELIIFKQQYDAINAAIKAQKRVFITTRGHDNRKLECAPYAVANSKEELHCYVLAVTRGCLTIRLSRITGVMQLESAASFTPEQINIFEKMKTFGPQFFYGADDGEVLVELTPKGIEKFKKIYVHRPIPDRTENNRYYFNCSHSQIIQYFTRFGCDAKIIYPKKVQDIVRDFHRFALNRYADESTQ